jgi:hypothetical protein
MRIAGQGAVWPGQDREEFVNEIMLEVLAASAGRPNKSLEIANFQQLAPIWLQAGVSPKFIVTEGLKVYDSRIEPEELFPLVAPSGAGSMIPQPSAPSLAGGYQPAPALPTQAMAPMPMQ